jgi:excisionase family DNA binding protein
MEYLTAKEATEYLKLKSVDALYRYVDQGRLKAYRLGIGKDKGSQYRFTREDIDAFVTGESTNANSVS